MKLINLNCITNSCNWYTYVTWRGNEYELSEDATIVSKHVGSVVVYKLIVIVLLLVILQNNKNGQYIFSVRYCATTRSARSVNCCCVEFSGSVQYD